MGEGEADIGAKAQWMSSEGEEDVGAKEKRTYLRPVYVRSAWSFSV